MNRKEFWMKFFRAALSAAAVLALAAPAAQGQLINREATIRSMHTTQYEVLSKKDGRIDVRFPDGTVIFENAYPAVLMADEAKAKPYKVDGKRGLREETSDELGSGKSILFGKDSYAWAVRTYETRPFLTVQMKYQNTGRKPVRIAGLVVWKSDGGDGKGLLLGGPPTATTLLSPTPEVCDAPALSSGGGESAWHLAAHDTVSGRSLIAGFLTADAGGGRFRLGYAPDAEQGHGADFEAVWEFEPPVELAPGASVDSPVLYLGVAEPDFGTGLRRYGKAAGVWNKSPKAAWTCNWAEPAAALTAARRFYLAPHLLRPDAAGADTAAWSEASRTVFGLLGGSIGQAAGVSFEPALDTAAIPAGLLLPGAPPVWGLPFRSTSGDWIAAAVVNPTAETRTQTLAFADIGVEPHLYHAVFDTAAGAYLGTALGELAVEVPAHGARLYMLRPWEDRPILLGHGNHASLGAIDYEQVSWDAATGELSATLRGPLRTEQPLWLHAPKGWSAPLAGRGALVFTREGKPTPAIPDGWTDIREGAAISIAPGGNAFALRFGRVAE